MENLLDSQLKQAFPKDVTESMMVDVLRMVKGDKDKAKEIAQGMGAQAEQEKKKERDRKITELQANFTDLDKNTIISVLEQQNWVVDNCIVPLFELVQKHKEAERRKQEEKLKQQRLKEKEERIKQAQVFLRDAFKNIPEKVRNDILERCNGDINVAVDQIKKMIEIENKKAQLLKAKELEQQLKVEREARIERLRVKFSENIKEEEVTKALEKNGWDISKATQELVKLSMKRKTESLMKIFKDFNEEQIKDALKATNGNTSEAVKLLDTQKAELKLKQQQQQQKQNNNNNNLNDIINNITSNNKDDDYMMMSKCIAQEVISEVDKELKENKSPQFYIKEELENLLLENLQANNNEKGLPGLRPTPIRKPVPKKDSPVVESDEESEEKNKKEAPVDTSILGTTDIIKEGEVSFTLSCSRAKVCDKIIVSVSAQNHTPQDWIGLYRSNAEKPHKQYETYQWVPSSNCKIEFKVPNKFGSFEFRYFRGRRGYALKGVSSSFSVGPEIDLELVREDNSKMEISVKYKEINVDNDSKKCKVLDIGWMALFDKEEKNNKNYITYDWVTSGIKDNNNNNDEYKRVINFQIPKNGDFEVRYFPHRRYYDTFVKSIHINDPDKLSVKKAEGDETVTKVKYSIHSVNPEMDYTWIGLFFKDEEDNTKWRRYNYVCDKEGEITFKTPLHSGIYEARLFANKSFVPILKSSDSIEVRVTRL